MLIPILMLVALLVSFILAWFLQKKHSLAIGAYVATLCFSNLLTAILYFGLSKDLSWYQTLWLNAAAFNGIVWVFGFMEFIFLPFISLFRLGAIVRVTYYEALLHPFTMIVIGLGLFVNSFVAVQLPYYTLSEDFKMYREVATQFVQLCALMVMVFASAKVIDEEIENRTMLTLMAKPISRWQVIIGKYLGVMAIVAVIIVVLGISTCVGSYLRYLEDMRIDITMAKNDPNEYALLMWTNTKGFLALLPLFTLQFLQLATLAAIAVAISTRYSLVLNVTAIVVIYVGANLTRFVPEVAMVQPWKFLANNAILILPFLSNFDLDSRLIYGVVNIYNEDYPRTIPTYAQIWQYVGLATVYGLCYIGAALSFATTLFRTRELT